MTQPDPHANPSRMPRKKGQPAPKSTERKPAANRVQCPACESKVPADSIDRTALSADALRSLDTTEKRGKYKSDAKLIQETRAVWLKRKRDRENGPGHDAA